MREYAKKEGVLWAIDTDVKVPALEDVLKSSPEDSTNTESKDINNITKDSVKFPVLPLRNDRKEKTLDTKHEN